ncbi:DUF4349 domain-containing protein [Bacillus sp. MRMR6]|uniref:DUF4349 domain-containing protein n=1 Tax=Bacillus sp. MRMR6 TaxID=1928617 RepID=UPI00095260FE|nr:DUF4349 domain-containing protein [Bacillus sp. MRMR6]OLS41939.1 hypothetical protein BTR25_00805 [Bacillus sp. MRMR6]
MKNRIRWYLSVLLISIVLFLAACSSNNGNDSAKMSEMNADKGEAMDSAQFGSQEKSVVEAETRNVATTGNEESLAVPNQMVIYQADLHLRVKKFEQTLQSLEEQVTKYDGYIAQSNVAKNGEEQVSGSIIIRIPQKHFQAFLHDAEGYAAEVLQRNITGTDVTEEYVDLEARLKSKRIVEERLISFMESATKTEDLLKISADLAAVQEEIERVQGRMKFLENQTSFSTITISLYENKVIIPKIEDDNLNTWEKTKKQFMESTNFLLAALSGFVVFIIGNLPILIILTIIGYLTYRFLRKLTKRNSQE